MRETQPQPERKADSVEVGVQAQAPTEREEMCDHICLKPASHVGESPHFYGYELPSPRRGPVVGYIVLTLTHGRWCDDWDGEVHPDIDAATVAYDAACDSLGHEACRLVDLRQVRP